LAVIVLYILLLFCEELIFEGREKRVVVRPDGHNIPSSQIESIAASFEEVELPVDLLIH